MADVTMPQLGETVTEGTITKWFKAVGDQIAEDEILFEVSTDKVDSEVPSPVSGYVAEILVPEGETVDVGVKLAVISSEPGAASGDGAAAKAEQPAAPAQAATSQAAQPAGQPAARAGERDEVIPFTRIRKVTAEHMVRSKATSAHTLVVIEVDYEGVERVRRAEKERFRQEEGISLTYLPFIARAAID